MTDNKYTGSPYFSSETAEEKVDPSNPITPEKPKELGQFIRTQATGDKVYFRVGEELHWVKNPDTLKALGGDFDKVVSISNEIFKTLNPRVEAIDMKNAGKYHVAEEVKPEEKVALATPQEQEVIHSEKRPGFTSIIIPAFFNSYSIFHTTGNCIGSIREHTNKLTTPYEIILVLNGDTGIKFANLQESKADKIITNDTNMGYAHAVNQGIRMSSGEYIAIVNNDTQEYDSWLEDMQLALRSGLDLVMATPMYGEPYARAVEAENKRLMSMAAGDITKSFSDFRDFSCVLTKKQLFDDIGLFNEDFFMYAEDLDLLRRMDKAGKKYASTKAVNIHHIIQGTASNVEDMGEIMNKSKAKLKEIWGE